MQCSRCLTAAQELSLAKTLISSDRCALHRRRICRPGSERGIVRLRNSHKTARKERRKATENVGQTDQGPRARHQLPKNSSSSSEQQGHPPINTLRPNTSFCRSTHRRPKPSTDSSDPSISQRPARTHKHAAVTGTTLQLLPRQDGMQAWVPRPLIRPNKRPPVPASKQCTPNASQHAPQGLPGHASDIFRAQLCQINHTTPFAIRLRCQQRPMPALDMVSEAAAPAETDKAVALRCAATNRSAADRGCIRHMKTR